MQPHEANECSPVLAGELGSAVHRMQICTYMNAGHSGPMPAALIYGQECRASCHQPAKL